MAQTANTVPSANEALDASTLLHSPTEIAAFIDRIAVGRHPVARNRASEFRGQPRYILSVVVDVQPLDDDLRPLGEPFQGETRDMSASGIGLLLRQAVEAKHLLVQLTSLEGEQMQAAVEVLRCCPLGTAFFDVGGCFVVTECDEEVEREEPRDL